MIYELAIVAKSELSAEKISALQALVGNVVKDNDGEMLIQDDWGNKTFAQSPSRGTKTGRYLYFTFKAGSENNKELNRRFKINEDILKTLIVKLSDTDEDAEKIVKGYRTPFSKSHNGSVTDDLEDGADRKAMRKFARAKQCWFAANSITADWKDPATYSWLVNEFGKISPARVSGISRKHQRFADTAIKRARQIGIISHLTNRIAE